MRVRLAPPGTLVSETACEPALAIVPPVQSAVAGLVIVGFEKPPALFVATSPPQFPPAELPVTTSLPFAFEVLLRTMPLLPGSLASMLRNVTSSSWIVVFATFSAVAVVVVSVLAPPAWLVTASVPPPVAFSQRGVHAG
jgi:hypothetical protein